jgi:hypothetical protein
VGADQRFESLAGLRIGRNIDAGHDVGRLPEVSKGVGDDRSDFPEGLTVNQGRRQFPGDCDRNLDGLGLEPALDVAQQRSERGDRGRNTLE